MAKRKRKKGSGSKLRLEKTYEEDQFIPYFHDAEAGILQTWEAFPDLRDGDVRQVLRGLISDIEKAGELPPRLQNPQERQKVDLEVADQYDMMRQLILLGLENAFYNQGPLSLEDTIGVLKRMNYSVGNMNLGMKGQNYLHFLSDFQASIDSKLF